MKKRFISKKRKRKKYKFLLFIVLFIISLVTTFKLLLKSNIRINDKVLVKLLLSDKNTNILETIYNSIKEYKPVKLLSTNNFELVNKKEETKPIINTNKDNNNDYLIYVYNTHQKEEYKATTFIENQVNPTVMMASYIMEDVFNKNNYKTLVEERSISDVLDAYHWKYYKSYEVSRMFLNEAKEKNPSIKYFIDVHRDSLSKDKTTTIIGDKSFAKVVFLIGTENKDYKKNLDFTNRINNKLNEKYPGLSKGVYEKGGEGVNGVYNQDNSEYTILIEIGGEENNTTEVLNSTLAFTEVFMEVINEG